MGWLEEKMKKKNSRTIDRLIRRCHKDSRFKKFKDGYRVCTIPLDLFPISCSYQIDGMRSLVEKDGTKEMYALCNKGYQPLREQWKKYLESVLPSLI